MPGRFPVPYVYVRKLIHAPKIIYTESLPTGRRTIDEEDFLWGWLAGQHPSLATPSAVRSRLLQ